MKIGLILIFLVIVGCSNNNPSNHEQFSKPNALRALMEKMGPVELPFVYDMVLEDDRNAKPANSNTTDSLFFDPYDGPIIGYLPDTTNYVAFLHLLIGDDFYPTLKIFDKKGNKIANQVICLGMCAGIGVDYEYCFEDLKIDNNLSISSSYCAKLYLESKKDYTKIDTVYNWQTGNGRITESGKIILDESEPESGNSKHDCKR